MTNYTRRLIKKIIVTIFLGSYIFMSCVQSSSNDQTFHKQAIVSSEEISVKSPNVKVLVGIPGLLIIGQDEEKTNTKSVLSQSELVEKINKLIQHALPQDSSARDSNNSNKVRIDEPWRAPVFKNLGLPITTNSTVSYSNTSAPLYFFEEDGRFKLMKELKTYCEWKERKETKAIASPFANAAIYQHIKEKIDEGFFPTNTDDSIWWENVKYLIDQHLIDTCYKSCFSKNYDPNQPEAILLDVCSTYIKWHQALLKRFNSLGASGELYSLYCETEKKDKKENNTVEAFLAQSKNRKAMDALVEFYIQKKLKWLSPWEEMNSILKKYKLPYQVAYKVNAAEESGKFSLIKITQQADIVLDLKVLSVEEKLMLDLMSWLFYFPKLSYFNQKPVPIKNIIIKFFDEASKELDAEFCKKLNEVILNEFIQKRQIGVIVTDRHLGKVILAPCYTKDLETCKEGN